MCSLGVGVFQTKKNGKPQLFIYGALNYNLPIGAGPIKAAVCRPKIETSLMKYLGHFKNSTLTRVDRPSGDRTLLDCIVWHR